MEDKLRTVLWQFSDEALNTSEVETLQNLLKFDFSEFNDLLTPEEIAAISKRAKNLLQMGRMPLPASDRPSIPWPPV